jgi:hypothetical protein
MLDDSAACSLPYETCPGGCIAAGGKCLINNEGDDPCVGGQVSMLSCGEVPAGVFCCLPLSPGPPIEAGITLLGGPDAATLDDGGACDLPAETCPGCVGGCVPVSCASQFPTPGCGADAGAGYCCLLPFNGGEVFNVDAFDAGEADSDTIGEFGFDCTEGVIGATTCPPLPAAIFSGPNAVGPLWVGCWYSYCYRSGGCVPYTCVAVDGGAAWEFDPGDGG